MRNPNELFGVTHLACCATATWALAKREAPKSQLYQVVRAVGMILTAIMAFTAAFSAIRLYVTPDAEPPIISHICAAAR
jgi:hypothetical protein